jgi:ubiquitin C-terminal hydrolase
MYLKMTRFSRKKLFLSSDLNMAPYCSSISEANQGQDNSSQSRYDLYGVINHRGTAWFGHYTSYARLLANNDAAKTEIGWRTFDDERVSALSNVKDIVRSDAYVLFYRHRHLSVNFSIQEQLQRLLTESTQ